MRPIELPRDWYPVVALARPGSFPLSRQFAMVLALVVLLIAFNLYAPARPTVLERGLASAFIALIHLVMSASVFMRQPIAAEEH